MVLLALLSFTLAQAEAPMGTWGGLADGGCQAGLQATSDAPPRCCWPAQSWSGASCVGAPMCPDGLASNGFRCGPTQADPLPRPALGPKPAEAAPAVPFDRVRVPLTLAELEAADAPSPEFREKAHAAELESLRALQALMQDTPDFVGEWKPGTYLRLAELYAEVGQNPGAGEDPLPWLQKADRLYEWLVATYPSWSQADEAAFRLGLARAALRQPDAALEALETIPTRYPDSAYVPEAWVQIGELSFVAGDTTRALEAFKRASSYPDRQIVESALGDFALYKLAWCQYDLGDVTQAVASMKAAVAAAVGADPRDVVLLAHAQGDLARFQARARLP